MAKLTTNKIMTINGREMRVPFKSALLKFIWIATRITRSKYNHHFQSVTPEKKALITAPKVGKTSEKVISVPNTPVMLENVVGEIRNNISIKNTVPTNMGAVPMKKLPIT